jgi:hypothetical protein
MQDTFEKEERQSQLDDLQVEIRRSEERLCELSSDIMESVLAIEAAKENHKALITERYKEADKLGRLRSKYADLNTEPNV